MWKKIGTCDISYIVTPIISVIDINKAYIIDGYIKYAHISYIVTNSAWSSGRNRQTIDTEGWAVESTL